MNNKHSLVTVDKRVRNGIPVVAGTRIPVENIIYLYEKKKVKPATIILKHYTQLSIDQVESVILWFEKNKQKYGLAI